MNEEPKALGSMHQKQMRKTLNTTKGEDLKHRKISECTEYKA